MCAVRPRTETIKVAAANPYRTDFLGLLAASKFVPLLSLEIRASSLAENPSSENGKLLLLLLSLNFSISPRKNEFSFGLFTPLESLSDS
jgi:hypothetical protein